jgi:uncharacterized protein (DUF2141 family)
MSKPTIASTLSAAALLCAAVVASSAALAGTIEVHVSNISNAKGQIRVAVCDQERFLKQCLHTASAPAQAGETVLKVSGVPAGTWAVLAYHDENGNAELDRNMLGIPKEDYGFSRDAASRFGPPKFADAAITVEDGDMAVKIKLH